MTALTVMQCLCCGIGYRAARTDLPKEERGVAELTRMVLDYKTALKKRDFDLAEKILEALDNEIANVDGVTRSHPDFEEVNRAAEKARPALVAARRRDRVEHLLGKLRGDIDRGESLCIKLTKDGPSAKLLEELNSLTESFNASLTGGETLKEDRLYSDSVPPIVEALGRFKTRAAEFDWLLQLSRELVPPINRALAAETAAKSDTGLKDRMGASTAAAAGFAECTEIITRYREADGYNDQLKIQSGLGDVSLDEAGLTCEMRRAGADQLRATLEWQQGVDTAAQAASRAVEALKASAGADAALALIGPALEALTECERSISTTRDQPGFDGSIMFKTIFGELKVRKLYEACNGEKERLAKANPALHWKSAIDRLRKRVGEAKNALNAAKSATTPEEKIKTLWTAVGGYAECLEQTQHLNVTDNPKWKRANPSARDFAWLHSLAKTCNTQQARAKSLLDRAESASRSKKKKSRRKRQR
ncbi:MAG: hypothetical protein A2289_05170 [Deltaproteobacteria bacterium RIFOXYA12_FULL_58_15]|nr:MAG: hypothetical protein A2289_05170 [Deltaproteobacteria bacterium RIFOXYA12_FULL_58_15]OGR08567.1 MAG: hypothetical protein A2341_25505 [Deltaproteobacteria bacterium RIFOXYB12_FULL_58_9]